MPTLAGIQGGSLVGDPSSALNLLLNTFGTKQSRDATELERQQQADLQRQIEILAGGGLVADQAPVDVPGSIEGPGGITGVIEPSAEDKQAALIRLSTLNPAMANAIRQTLERGDTLEAAKIAEKTKEGTELALLIQGQGDFIGKQRALTQAAQTAASQGEDVTRFVELSNMSEPQLDLELEKMLIQGADLQTLIGDALAPEESEIAGGAIVKGGDIKDGFVVRQQPDGTFTSTRVLDDTEAGLSAGQKEFNSLIKGLNPEQQLKARMIKLGLSPRAVGNAIQTITDKGIAEEIGNAEAIIGERKKFGELTGSSRAKAIDSGIASIQKIDKNVKNLDRAIAAVEDGAGVGFIENKFPSIKAAAVELDQIQGELALDVIGAVTFGALSKGELDLAKEIALPTNLNTAELIAHLKARQVAQGKLRDYFSAQIEFLDTGGSVAGFLREQERNATKPDETATLSDDELFN